MIADFNNDGILDAFVAGGHAEYPEVENNFGRVYMVSWGEGNGPEWKMFRRDYHRSGCICNDSLLNPQEPVAIQNITQNIFQLYPNPASSQLHIEINGAAQKTIILMDVMGRTIKTYCIYENNFDLDISMLPAGIYSIEILQDKDSATQLFVKE